MELKKFDDKSFTIYIYYNKKQKPVVLKNCFCSDMFERFYVYGKNSAITIQNNRPELRRLNKSSHKFTWKMIVGPTDIPLAFLQTLFDAMESYIENVIEGGEADRQNYMRNKKGPLMY